MPFAIRPRAFWLARKAKAVTEMTRPIGVVYIHHTAGAAPPNLPQSKVRIEQQGEGSVLRATQNYHMDTLGWSDIAYNILIAPSGRAYKGRGWYRVGAHNDGENSSSYGICVMGNFDAVAATDRIVDGIVRVIKRGQARGHLTKTVFVKGHRDSDATSCPGKNLYARLPEIRRRINAR